MQINRQVFFDEYISQFGKIKYKTTVENINTMLDNLIKYSGLYNNAVFIEQMSYIAATVHHETGSRYSAFKEKRQVSTNTAYRRMIKRLQDRYWYSGYYGRGPVQLTWKRNYQWAEKATRQPLVETPDLLLEDLDLGYEVTIKGMTQGAYTGKALNAYINQNTTNYNRARRVVNGSDKAQKIADYARKFEKILTKSVSYDEP